MKRLEQIQKSDKPQIKEYRRNHVETTVLLLAFLTNAGENVNMYFPAAAVERAADEIVKETWGSRTESAPKGTAQPASDSMEDRIRHVYRRSFRPRSRHQYFHAAIRALKDSIRPKWIYQAVYGSR